MSCLTASFSSISSRVAALRQSEGGQDLLEYGVLVGLIALVAVTAVTTLGNQIDQVLWNHIVNNF